MAAHRPLTPAAQRAMGFWGVIELAAEVHATTADLWSWIRDEAERLGLPSPGVTVQGVAQLRARAGQIQESARKFATLKDNQRVRGEHVARPPWERELGTQRAQPKFAVRFRHEFLKGDEVVSEWRTSVFVGKVNHTAGQLRRDVELDAQNMAEKYDTEHLGISDLQILEF